MRNGDFDSHNARSGGFLTRIVDDLGNTVDRPLLAEQRLTLMAWAIEIFRGSHRRRTTLTGPSD
jgi:hypothetical protein